MFVYHVCAKKDNKYFDGIIICDKKITLYENYDNLKKTIAEKMYIKKHITITILSLSFLHEVSQ